MNEYVIVRMDRPEAGSTTLPVDDPRRCRWYITGTSESEALGTAAKRWPKESNFVVVETRANVPPKFNNVVKSNPVECGVCQ